MEANVGSRPAKRNTDDKLHLEDLRAIPYVGAWAQLRQNILGFYGVGLAIHELSQHDSNYIDYLHDLYCGSLFFKTLINNIHDSLTKSNFAITAYLEHDHKFGKFWQMLTNEAKLTSRFFSSIISDQSTLSRSSVTVTTLTNVNIITPNSPTIPNISTLPILPNSTHDQGYATHSQPNLREKIILPLLIIQQYAMIKIRDDTTVDKSIYEKLIKKSLAANINANRNSI